MAAPIPDIVSNKRAEIERDWSPLEAPVIKASLPSNDLAFVFGGTTCGIPLVIFADQIA